MAASRTSEQSTNRMNRLTIAANYPPNIAPTQLQFEDGRFTAGNFREHHLIGVFHQLSNDELEKFFHVASGVAAAVSGGATGAGSGSAGVGAAAAGAGAACFLFFLIKLRTVSDG